MKHQQMTVKHKELNNHYAKPSDFARLFSMQVISTKIGYIHHFIQIYKTFTFNSYEINSMRVFLFL